MIRPATPTDIPAILALIKELAVYEKLTDICTATEALLHQHLFGDQKTADAFITEIQINNTPTAVGYAIVYKTFSSFLARPGLYLEDIYVQPAHRGKGLGKALLQHLAKICLQKNYARLEWTCLDWNTPSLNFYKSLGAKNLTEWNLHRLTGENLKALAEKQL
jgi:GNAT superfamily N-acetyltransferase